MLTKIIPHCCKKVTITSFKTELVLYRNLGFMGKNKNLIGQRKKKSKQTKFQKTSKIQLRVLILNKRHIYNICKLWISISLERCEWLNRDCQRSSKNTKFSKLIFDFVFMFYLYSGLSKHWPSTNLIRACLKYMSSKP